MHVALFKFRLTSTGASTSTYGRCEHCQEPASEMFHLVRYHYFAFHDGRQRREGWAYDTGTFGHEPCLRRLMRPVLGRRQWTALLTLPTPHALCCCCCGEATVGRQWWNRDTGYGLCERCAVWLPTRGTTPEEMKELYGERGVHYDLSYGCSAAVSVS